MTTDITAILYDLAAVRANVQPQLDSLDAELLALKMRRTELQAQLDAAETETRAALQAYVRNEGDLQPHPAVQARRVLKWVYDKDAVLAQAVERGDRHLIRVKQELNVREFERQLSQGFVRWANAEQVNEVVIAIDTRLGDLLIAGGGE